MSNWLDYDGLILYHNKIMEILKRGSSGQAIGISEETASMYGLGDDATADDIFQFLYLTSAQGSSVIRFKAEYQDGIPCAGVGIDITKNSGNLKNIILGKSGVYLFKAASGESVTIRIASDFADITGSATVTAPENGILPVTIKAEYRNFLSVNATTSVRFSDKCFRVDASLAAGGGGGGGQAQQSSNYYYSGGGGGGGECIILDNVEFTPFENYQLKVGAGGSYGTYGSTNNSTDNVFQPGRNGTAGGETSAFGITARGGNGGTISMTQATGYSGNGGAGTSGKQGMYSHDPVINKTGAQGGNSTSEIYTSFDETQLVGGGGAGGAMLSFFYNNDSATYTVTGGAGGSPNGGKSGSGRIGHNYGQSIAESIIYEAQTSETGGIAGGGGGCTCFSMAVNATATINTRQYHGGSGGPGIVTLRMYHST